MENRLKCKECMNEICKKRIAKIIKDNFEAIEKGDCVTFNNYEELNEYLFN